MGQSIGAILRAEQIELNLQADDGFSAIRSVTARLRQHPAVRDLDQLCREVIAREQLSSTALTHSVAVPHARTEAVNEIVVAVGRSRTPIPFGNEKRPVQLIFIIGTPPDQIVGYLAAVGNLARLVKDATTRQRLLETNDVSDFLAALR